jgi:glutamate/tyrosine decarboxylase-like PLP-dependent enzyme
MELADSIGGDAHKLLNVPYDCGFFFSRHLENATNTFANTNAAYLSISFENQIPSPLNIGLENSRRFRALPAYANLVAYGRTGCQDMLKRQIGLARGIARFIVEHESFILLGHEHVTIEQALDQIYIIILFRAVDDEINQTLVERINSGREIYVSGTSWQGLPACRFAVANWQADVDRDLPLIKRVLDDIVAGQKN